MVSKCNGNTEKKRERVKPRYSHSKVDEKIFPDRYYCWYYNDNLSLKQNLAPVSWETRKLAVFVLKKTLGEDIFKKKTIHIIKGSVAKRYGLSFGKRTIRVDGKVIYIRKFYIPPEWDKDKYSRRHFMLRIYRKSWEKGIQKYYHMVYRG